RAGDAVDDADHADAAFSRVLDRKAFLQPASDPIQFTRGLRRREAGAEPADAVDEVDGVARAAPRIAIGDERQHEVDIADRRRKSRRQDADDRVLLAIQPDRAADDAAIAAEAAHPERLGEDHDVLRAWLLVGGLQQASQAGTSAEDVEEVPGRAKTGD